MLHVAASIGHVGLIRTFLEDDINPNALAKVTHGYASGGCVGVRCLYDGCAFTVGGSTSIMVAYIS